MYAIEIVVTDRETGSPLEDAHVGVFLVRDPDEREAEPRATLLQGNTDAEGRCLLRADLEPGEDVRVRPVVRARGHAEWKEWFGPALPSRAEAPVEATITAGGTVRLAVALERGTTLRGTVTDPSGRPVAGAEIGLVLSSPSGCSWPHAFGVSHSVHWPPPCRTDEDGAYEWLSFPIEAADASWHYVLMAGHDDFARAMVHSVETLPADESGVIRVDVALTTGCTLEGIVLLPDGTPAHDAGVKLTARPDAEQPVCVNIDKAASTDADGRFLLRGLKRTVHRMEVEMTGCASHSSEIDLSSGADVPCRIHLQDGQDLQGRVLDRNGAPIADAHVIAVVREPRTVRQTRTDAEGRFRVVGLPTSGRVEVRCVPSINADVELPSPPLTLRAPAFVALRVRLLAAESGDPLGPPGYVGVQGPGFSTGEMVDSEGRIEQARTPAGHYELKADVPDRAVVTAEVDLPEEGLHEEVVIRVPQGGAARGVVTGGGGRPLANVAVTAYGRHAMHQRRALTDAQGAYEIRGLGEWAYLTFTREGLALRLQPVRPTGTRESPVVVNVTMGPGATVMGRVVHGDERPAVRVRVTTAKPDRRGPWELPSALTGEDGTFVLHHVPRGKFVVATGTAKAIVDSRDGAELHVDLRID